MRAALVRAAFVAGALALCAIRPTAAAAQTLPPLTGAKPFATLLCKFADFPDLEPAAKAHFDQIMSAPTYPSVTHYWNEVGNGRFSLEGSRTYGWFLLPQPSSYYVSTFAVKYAELQADCAAAADADVNFAEFWGLNIVVNGNLNGILTIGNYTATLDGVQKLWHTTFLDASIVNAFGLAAHEIGHTFGLPHTSGPYGSTYDSHWDVMSNSAPFPIAGTTMRAPAHINAYQKRVLGLIRPERIVTAPIGTTIALLERHARPAENANPLMIVVPVPGSYTTFSPAPYYILELRGGPGSGYDVGFPEPVVVMHYVDPLRGVNVLDVDANGDPNDAGASWMEGETFVDRANDITIAFGEQVGSTMSVTVRVGDRNVIALSPASRRRELAFGDSAARADSTAIAITGPTAGTVAWRATARGSSRRLVIEGGSGTDDALLRFTMHPAQLAPGTYIDTVSVTADAAVNRVVHFVDTLVVTPSPVLAVGLVPASRTDSLLSAQTRMLTAAVRPDGPGADTVTWTAAKAAAWIELLNGGAGTGPNGAVQWRHDAGALGAGTYVDTITVTLSNGAVAWLVDTLRVLPRPALALNRLYGAATLPQESGFVLDSVSVSVTGPWASGAALSSLPVVGQPVYLAGDPRPPVGGGWVRLRRSTGTLAPGTYVNRLRIALSMDAAQYVEYTDTLHVRAVPSRVLLSASSARDTVLPGSSYSIDSVMVRPEGPNAATTKWESSANFAKTLLMNRGTLPYGSGTGTGWLVWARNSAEDGPGIYVDTLWVRFTTSLGDSARLIDTLVIQGPPALVVAATSRRRVTMTGATAALPDSATVTLDPGIAWSASSRRASTTLVTSSGTGSGMLRWRRDPSGLAEGAVVDTIAVTAAGVSGSPHRIVDTLVILPALVVQSDAVRPAGVMGAAYQDALTAAGGTGVFAWTLTTGVLPPGVALDAGTGALTGIPTERGEFQFTARVTSDTFFVERVFTVTIGVPQLIAGAVLDQLLGGAPLGADGARFLDLQGNRNGRVDIGDVRAWLASESVQAHLEREPSDSIARLRAIAGVPR